MTRITVKDLEAVCARINRAVNGTDETPVWVRDEDGVLSSPLNVYHLSGAYGGYSLHRTVTDGGGISDVFGCGYIAKRELYDRMQALLRGFDIAFTSTR
jgi:hypothetical protein